MRNPLNMKAGRISCILLMVFASVVLQPFTVAVAEDNEIRFWVDRFVIDGENPISASRMEKVLAIYTGRLLTFSGLEAAASSLQATFMDAGYPFHRVALPPQRIIDGEVKLRVVAFPLKDIRVEGNRNFDVQNILGTLPPLKIGESPNTLAVARALQFANGHPSKRIAAFIKQAPDGEGIDARVVARDTRPYSIFGNLNNTGTKNPGRTRTALGVQHSNLFNRDHILTATYTTSPESLSDVNQYGVDYRLPLYAIATELEVFYSYSEIDQGTIGDFFNVSGRGQFWGFNATHTLLPTGAYNHKFALGYQDRFFDNETSFLGTSLIPDVRSTPLSFRYSFNYEPKNLSIGGYAAWGFNTGFGSHNNSENYHANREGADRDWNKFNGGVHLSWLLPGDFQLQGRFDGQYSDQPLISGEQFGVGGHGSVRGYEERELTGDYGLQASIEAWSPPLILDSRVVCFADVGQVRRHSPQPGGDGRDSASSIGIGLRWNWRGHIDVGLDVAHALEDAITTEARDTRILYRVFLRF